MKRLLVVFTLVVAILGAASALRWQRFAPRQLEIAPAVPIQLDRTAALQRLARAIRYQTIAVNAADEASAAEIERFHVFLMDFFPTLHARLVKETVNRHSLLYTWQGSRADLKPILLLAHMDVVPVDEDSKQAWHQPPFAGAIADGFVWGRGTMDDKASLMSILEAVEYLIGQGFQPERTIYLAFGHDEESGGQGGAAKIAELLRSREIQFEYVLDEGSNILDGLLAKTNAPAALVGVAEKGYLSLALSVETEGGHSSIPPAQSAIGTLSRAIAALERTPFPSRLAEPTRQMLNSLGPHMAWPERYVLANLWLFNPWVRYELAQSPLTNAAIRTTQAVTRIDGGIKDNVLPTMARAVVNLRLLPDDTVNSAILRVRNTIDNPAVTITAMPIPLEPSPASDTSSPSFTTLHQTIRQIMPEAIVAPSLVVAATDSRHYSQLTKNIYRFFPITLHTNDLKRYHGVDERIATEDYVRCIRFYVQLIKNSQALGK